MIKKRSSLILLTLILLGGSIFAGSTSEFRIEEMPLEDPLTGTGLNFPTDMAFSPDATKLFIAEKNTGRLRLAELQPDGRYLIRAQPFATLPVVIFPTGYHERGLTGVAVDPYYPDNPYVYVHYTGAGPRIIIARLEDQGGIGVNPATLMSITIPNNSRIHVAGKLEFDWDANLFVSVGEIGQSFRSQDLADPRGKIHRISPWDGSPAPGNPFPGSTVWAYGIRHSYGLCLHGGTGEMYATDNGQNCDDRVIKVTPGTNFGWGLPPTPSCPFGPAIWRSGSTQVAPTGCTFYFGDEFPDVYGDLLFGEWNTRRIRRVRLAGVDLDELDFIDVFFAGSTSSGRVTSVKQSPAADGRLYFTSCLSPMFPPSCTQGRLFRLVPAP